MMHTRIAFYTPDKEKKKKNENPFQCNSNSLCTFPALATHQKMDDEGHAGTRNNCEKLAKKPEVQWAWRILHTQMWMRLQVSSHGQIDEWITHDRGNLIQPCGLAKDFLSNDSGVRACVRAC
jgi:hypothetical protein